MVALLKFIQIILQVINGLKLAYERFEYSHNDLHDSNILIQEYTEPIFIPYFFDDKIRYIETKYVATIIDFGQSFVKKNGKGYGFHDYDDVKIFSHRSNPIGDIYKLIMFSSITAKNTSNFPLYFFLSKFYQKFDEGITLDKRIEKWEHFNEIFMENDVNLIQTKKNGEKMENDLVAFQYGDNFNYGLYRFQSQKEKKIKFTDKNYSFPNEYNHEDFMIYIEENYKDKCKFIKDKIKLKEEVEFNISSFFNNENE